MDQEGKQFHVKENNASSFLHLRADKMTGPLIMMRRLHNLYSSPSIIRMIKSRRMRWEVHVARMGEKRNAYRILVGMSEAK
jgi:hypothetical protein